jgi:hypothetical protein
MLISVNGELFLAVLLLKSPVIHYSHESSVIHVYDPGRLARCRLARCRLTRCMVRLLRLYEHQELAMSISPRAFLKLTLLCLVAGTFIPRAAASTLPVSYSYSGSVQSVSQDFENATGVVAGDTITGTFTYSPAQPETGNTGLYNFTGSTTYAHSFTLAIFSSGSQIFSDQFTGNTSGNADYYAAQVTYNTSGTTFTISGDTAATVLLGYTYEKQGVAPYNLTLTDPNNAGGYTANNLPIPTSTTIKDFVGSTANLAWGDGYTFGATITQFQAIVPEPSSLVMAITGCLLGAGGIVRLRRMPAH